MSEVKGLTRLVLLSGEHNAKFERLFMVFKNEDGSPCIRVVIDYVPRASYRTSPKEGRYNTVMIQSVDEKRVITSLPKNRQRVTFMDNCIGYIRTP